MVFIRNTILVKDMLHQFPAVYIDLDVEREPCLYLYKHEAKLFIQIVKVIMQAFGNGGFQEMFSFPANDLCSPAGFQGFEDTDKTAVHRSGKEEIFGNVFFPVLCREIYNRASEFFSAAFDLSGQVVSDILEISSEIPQGDTHGIEGTNPGLFRKKRAEIAVDDHAVKKRKLPLDFISELVYHFAHRVEPLCWFLIYVHYSTVNRVLALFYFGCGRRSAL